MGVAGRWNKKDVTKKIVVRAVKEKNKTKNFLILETASKCLNIQMTEMINMKLIHNIPIFVSNEMITVKGKN